MENNELKCKKCNSVREKGNKLCKKCNATRIAEWKRKHSKIRDCDYCWQPISYYGTKEPKLCSKCYRKELAKKWKENNPNKRGLNNKKKIDYSI